jgi:hypothetical protein
MPSTVVQAGMNGGMLLILPMVLALVVCHGEMLRHLRLSPRAR